MTAHSSRLIERVIKPPAIYGSPSLIMQSAAKKSIEVPYPSSNTTSNGRVMQHRYNCPVRARRTRGCEKMAAAILLASSEFRLLLLNDHYCRSSRQCMFATTSPDAVGRPGRWESGESPGIMYFTNQGDSHQLHPAGKQLEIPNGVQSTEYDCRSAEPSGDDLGA